TFSPNHPLEPPCATLRTPIYHPSVDLEGRVCQPLTTKVHWEPTTRAVQGGHRGDRQGHSAGGTSLTFPP
ncbi:UBC84 enzyme, partial [Drymodes brunneopygia]|nr:UBC84 enzyme [Drymodes brunneopygia]